MKPWKRIEPTEIHKVGYRTFVTKTFIYPDGTIGKYDIKDRDGWAGVATIALTPDNRVLIVRQFRAGPECVMDELPGGAVEEGEEDILKQAALRELQEETGYMPGRIYYLGKLSYDAHANGWRHYFLARNCKLSGDGRQLDESEQHEQLEVRKITVAQLFDNAVHGRMTDPGAVLLAYKQLQQLKEKHE